VRWNKKSAFDKKYACFGQISDTVLKNLSMENNNDNPGFLTPSKIKTETVANDFWYLAKWAQGWNSSYLSLIKHFNAQVVVKQHIGEFPVDVMRMIFEQVDLLTGLKIMNVCKNWFLTFSLESNWRNQCLKLNAPPKPEEYSWYCWFIIIYRFGAYNPSILTEELSYFSFKTVLKFSSSPDISNALVGIPLSSGKIYAEFIVKTKGSEIYVGVTPSPQYCIGLKGSAIIRNQEIWAYTCGCRFGIQVMGETYPADRYIINDRIGVFLNIDDKEVSFFKKCITKPGFPIKKRREFILANICNVR